MSKPRVDYASLPQAPRIVKMYLAAEKVGSIVRKTGFSDEKIRTVLKACGVKMRPAGRPGPAREEKPLPPEITIEWHNSRAACWHCGIRLDIGCKHHPAKETEAA